MKLSKKQQQMESCDHWRIEQVGPSRWSSTDETWRSKMKCPDCPFWYIQERHAPMGR